MRRSLPKDLSERRQQLRTWNVPPDAHSYILRKNLVPLMERVIAEFDCSPSWVGKLFGHLLKNIEGTLGRRTKIDRERLYQLFAFVHERKLDREILKELLPMMIASPAVNPEAALGRIGYRPRTVDEVLASIPALFGRFRRHKRSKAPDAAIQWIMGQLRPSALGNVPFDTLRAKVEKEVSR